MHIENDVREECQATPQEDLRRYLPRVVAMIVAFVLIFAFVTGMPFEATGTTSKTESPEPWAPAVSLGVAPPYTSEPMQQSKLLITDDSENYYRGFLDDDGKQAYDVIEEGIRSFSTSIRLERGYSAAELNKLVGYVLMDCPDILWFDGTMDIKGHGDSYDRIVPEYILDYPSSEGDLVTFLHWAAAAPRSDDESEQMQLLMDYIADDVSHDRSGKNDQTIGSILNGGTGVCAGYAKLAVLLSRYYDIPAVYVVGQANGERHAWMAARVNGRVLYYDPYWYDGDGVTNPQWIGCPLDVFSQSHATEESRLLPTA